jgi:Immunity protein 53
MDAIEFLQAWYHAQTNGEWEHARGVTIETLDNPGWRVTIDLLDTPLAGIAMAPIRLEKSPLDWLVCEVERDQFRGNGDPQKLLVILQAFQSWAEEAVKVK